MKLVKIFSSWYFPILVLFLYWATWSIMAIVIASSRNFICQQFEITVENFSYFFILLIAFFTILVIIYDFYIHKRKIRRLLKLLREDIFKFRLESLPMIFVILFHAVGQFIFDDYGDEVQEIYTSTLQYILIGCFILHPLFWTYYYKYRIWKIGKPKKREKLKKFLKNESFIDQFTKYAQLEWSNEYLYLYVCTNMEIINN